MMSTQPSSPSTSLSSIELLSTDLSLEAEPAPRGADTAPSDDHDSSPAANDDARNDPASALGELAATFELVRVLGEGPTGIRFLVQHRESGREGLLKILAGSLGEARERTRRELGKQTSVRHPALVTPFEVLDHGETLAIFRPFVPGETLAERLSAGPLPLREWLGLAGTLADALHHLHGASLLFRDLAPRHVVFTPDGRTVLIDAGVAPRVETDTVEGLLGTPAYLAPEQIEGKLPSFRADLFALGALIYEAATGRALFARATDAATLAVDRSASLELDPNWPPAAQAIVAQLLAAKSGKRPTSARKVATAFAAALKELDVAEAKREEEAAAAKREEEAAAKRDADDAAARAEEEAEAAAQAADEVAHDAVAVPREEALHAAPAEVAPSVPVAEAAAIASVELESLEVDLADSIESTEAGDERAPSVAVRLEGAQVLDDEVELDPSVAVSAAPGGTMQLAIDELEDLDEERALDPSMPAEVSEEEVTRHVPRELLGGPVIDELVDEGAADEGAAGEDARHADADTTAVAPNPSEPPAEFVEAEPTKQVLIEELVEAAPREISMMQPPLPSIPSASQARAEITPEERAARMPIRSLPPPSVSPSVPPEGPRPSTPIAPPTRSRSSFPELDRVREPELAPAPAVVAPVAAPAVAPAAIPAAGTPAAVTEARAATAAPEAPGVAPVSDAPPATHVATTRTDETERIRTGGARNRRDPVAYVPVILAAAVLIVAAAWAYSIISGNAQSERTARLQPPEGAYVAPKPGARLITDSAPRVAAPEVSEVANPPAEAAAPALANSEPTEAAAEAAAEAADVPASDSTADPASPAAVDPASGGRPAPASTAERERATSARPTRERSRTGEGAASAMEADRFATIRDSARDHFRAGRVREAAIAYQTATTLRPREPGVWAGLGAARLRMGDSAGAIQAYQRAVLLNPRSSGFFTSLGHAYRASGQQSSAVTAYRRALSLDADNPSARRALESLGISP